MTGTSDDKPRLNIKHGACCDPLALFCIYSPSLVSYPIYISYITLLQLDRLRIVCLRTDLDGLAN